MYNDKVIDVVELDRKEQILNQLKESLNVSKDSEVVGIIEEYFKQKRSYEKSIELEKVQPVIDAINEKDPGYYWFRIK
ncbi:MAG: hypothetical protein GY861_28670, partial [bacterium]|nr:hypothetical protein [bacterium]